MSEPFFELLASDHRRLQRLAAELVSECSQPVPSEGACFLRFRTMKALFAAQSKAEEYSICAHIEEDPAIGDAALRCLIFECYEEHDLADLILKEMAQAEEVTPQWCSKLKVFSELLAHHIEKEEKKIMPLMFRQLAPEVSASLRETYVRERDQIFAKKSGLKPPAPFSRPEELKTH